MTSNANCLISIAGDTKHPNAGFPGGVIRVKATRVTHGMSIVEYSTSGDSRRYSAFYPSKMTSGSFELDVIFSSHRGYEATAKWLQQYSRWVSNANTPTNPVRVIIPDRDFDKTGILETGLTFGDTIGTSYRMTLSFVGSKDPVEMIGKNFSTFLIPGPARKDAALPYLYPAGNPLKADEFGQDLFAIKPGYGLNDGAEDVPQPPLPPPKQSTSGGGHQAPEIGA